MISQADNATVPRRGQQLTVPDPADRRPVRLRVACGAQERLVDGLAHAWTTAVVYVAWADDQGLQHRDWFDAADVRAV